MVTPVPFPQLALMAICRGEGLILPLEAGKKCMKLTYLALALATDGWHTTVATFGGDLERQWREEPFPMGKTLSMHLGMCVV